MKIKLFDKKADNLTKELEQELVLAGLLRADRDWAHRSKVQKFAKTNLEDIKVYWERLPKSIKTQVFDKHINEFDALLSGTYATSSQNLFEETKNYRELLAIGLEEVFMPDRYGNRSKENKARGDALVVGHPELLAKSVQSMDNLAQINVLKSMAEHAFYLFETPFWTTYLKGIVAKISSSNPYSMLHEQLGHLVMMAVDLLDELTGEVKWFELYESMEVLASKVNRESNVFSRLVELVAVNETDSFMKYVKSVGFKKKHRTIRAAAYKGIIKSGFLDEKIARRIRSDSSERVSTACIKVLFSSLDIYPNKDELLGQFLDTRYDRVGYELVEHSPDKYLPFLVGVKGSSAKKLLEKRMNEAAKKGTI